MKYWRELTDAERIERTRQAVRCLIERVDGQNDRIEQILVHLHDGGTVVVPIGKGRGQHRQLQGDIGGASRKKDDVYF